MVTVYILYHKNDTDKLFKFSVAARVTDILVISCQVSKPCILSGTYLVVATFHSLLTQNTVDFCEQ